MNSTGSKIKTFTKWVSTIIIILSVIIFVNGLYLYIENSYAIKYATLLGGASSYYSFDSLVEAGDDALFGLISIIGSLILLFSTIITSLVVYGFGEMIENTARIACIADRLEKRTSKESHSINL